MDINNSAGRKGINSRGNTAPTGKKYHGNDQAYQSLRKIVDHKLQENIVGVIIPASVFLNQLFNIIAYHHGAVLQLQHLVKVGGLATLLLIPAQQHCLFFINAMKRCL